VRVDFGNLEVVVTAAGSFVFAADDVCSVSEELLVVFATTVFFAVTFFVSVVFDAFVDFARVALTAFAGTLTSIASASNDSTTTFLGLPLFLTTNCSDIVMLI
jgi:hypothetical protein